MVARTGRHGHEPQPEHPTGLAAEALQRAVVDNLVCLQARYPAIATPHDWYMALAYSVRDRLLGALGRARRRPMPRAT